MKLNDDDDDDDDADELKKIAPLVYLQHIKKLISFQ
jgi:hypothetical protein